MIEQLRELAETQPFEPFTIVMRTGDKFHIRSSKEIEFTHYGSPKVHSSNEHGKLGELAKRKRWHILNVDAIVEIIL